MARALLLALTCAAAASAARYADYSGVKMPAYGAGDYEAPREPAAAPLEDYRGHSPDAPASPDYKYEEEPRVKTEKPGKDSDESEVWRKPGRKQRGLMRPPLENAGIVHKYEREDDEVPKYRSSHRYPKHRSRLKPEPSIDEPPRRAKYSRDRKDDVSDIDSKDYFPVDKEDFPDDKSKNFDEEVKFVNEATTRRRAGRKPRDRFIKRKSSDLDFAYDDDDLLDTRPKSDDEQVGGRRTRPPRPPPPRHEPVEAHDPFPPQPPPDEDEERTRVQPLAKLAKQKPYADYDDYYDMKRVNNIKSKIPQLLRRPTTERAAPTPTSYLDMLWTNRRMVPLEGETKEPPPATVRVFSPRPKTPTPTTTTRRRRTTTTLTTPLVTSTTVTTTTSNATALSLAEKSRLSILKKDARKKGQHVDASTAKPPVLLQVTQYVPTVVMVEPPSSVHPYLRVRELSDDSPARLERVKKLMRHKLVADAKSIHDLTSNWDEMVCDYIDTALLDKEPQSAAPPRAPSTPLALYSFLQAYLVLHGCVFV